MDNDDKNEANLLAIKQVVGKHVRDLTGPAWLVLDDVGPLQNRTTGGASRKNTKDESAKVIQDKFYALCVKC